MRKETHEIDVANGRIITQPGLIEEDKERARSHEVSLASRISKSKFIPAKPTTNYCQKRAFRAVSPPFIMLFK